MNEPIVLTVIEPKNRRERRAIEHEIERAIGDFNEIENLFLDVLFDESINIEYNELYRMALRDWTNVTSKGYKINRFFYTCPNIRYFEEKYKPLEHAN